MTETARQILNRITAADRPSVTYDDIVFLTGEVERLSRALDSRNTALEAMGRVTQAAEKLIEEHKRFKIKVEYYESDYSVKRAVQIYMELDAEDRAKIDNLLNALLAVKKP